MTEDLEFGLSSVAEMTLERAVKVGEAFDRYPDLRPLKVGGDPARIRVGDSMADLIRRAGLPIDWCTIRDKGRRPDLKDYEMGEISLHAVPWYLEADEGFESEDSIDGEWVGPATHKVSGSFNAATMSDPGRVEQVLGLFTDLAVALDVMYGLLSDPSGPLSVGAPLAVQLPGIYWVQVFGPAFVQRWPDLSDVDGARTLESGAVLIQTNPKPGVQTRPGPGRLDAPWMQPILDVLGTDPFTQPYGFVSDGRAVPSEKDHVAAAPRNTPKPSIQELKLAYERRRGRDRYPKTRLRRLKLEEERSDPAPLGSEAHEFSTSFDVDVFQEFWKLLRRELKGDLQGTYGTVLAREISTAPLDHEDETLVNTRHGTVSVHWSIGDYDVVDLYLFGPLSLQTWCFTYFED